MRRTRIVGGMALMFLAARVRGASEGPAAQSAWFRFDSIQTAGESRGANPWPAEVVAATVAPGKQGHGLSLSGQAGNGLYLPNPASFFGEEARAGTIALWVQPDFEPKEGAGQQVLFDFMRDAGNTLIDGYEIVLFTDGAALKAKPSLVTQMEITNPLHQGEWTHLTLTWDCEQGTALFVNGEKKAERQGRFEPTNLEKGWPGRIGCHTPFGGYPFKGTIDELRLFNRQLSEEEVRAVATAQVTEPALAATGDWIHSLSVHNRGREPVALTLEAWLPARHTPPPYFGYLPISFWHAGPDRLSWIAGVTAVERWSEPIVVPPGTGVKLPVRTDPTYLGRRRVRLMAGTGVNRWEVAARDFPGLVVEPVPFRPLVYYAQRSFTLRARLANGLGRAFAGSIRAELYTDGGKRLGASTVPVNLAAGKQREMAFTWRSRLPVGRYQVRFWGEERGAETLLEAVALHTTEEANHRTICDVAAAYTRDDEATLSAMARDGVAAVRQGGKYGDYYSSEKTQSELLRHGFKSIRMAVLGYSACVDERRHRDLRRMAANLGRYLKDNLAVLNQVISGEGLSAPPCYCRACDRSFRSYLEQRYGSLESLNRSWGSAYKAWSEVQQLGSPRDVDEAAEKLKRMPGERELPADPVARWQELFALDRPRAMEWKRWHDQGLMASYRSFIDAFRAANGGHTALSEQPCWPNFQSHILFALEPLTDLGGMDLYLPGEGPTTLGYVAELCLNFDLNASLFAGRGKPVIVHELYVQNNSPELLPEAQGWWLLGRGYNLLTYFTYNHYEEGLRANQPLIFGLFDQEGKPYPSYPSFVRFSRAIKEFHRRYNFATLRREEPRIALFMGDDVSLANNLETGGETWNAAAVHGHNGAYWLTERCGFPVEFINDSTFDRLRGKKVLVVPWCHVVGAGSVARMLAFARAGGTLLFDGAIALYDENYRPYKPLPGAGLAEALGVTFAGYEDKPNKIVLADGTGLPSQGVPMGVKVTKGTVALKDPEGRPALVEIPLGKGRVLFFLTNLGRRNLSRKPDPNALQLWASLLEKRGGLRPRFRFTPQAEPGRQNVFDVSLRIRDDRELFLFLTSFFEPTEGTLSLDLPKGSYRLFDALTGEALPARPNQGELKVKVSLPAYGSCVLRLVAQAGKPFVSW
jgi:hypothetical protein